MKKTVLLFSVCFLLMVLLSSCGVASNYIVTGYLKTAEKDGTLYIESRFSTVYEIDLQTKTFSLVENVAGSDVEWNQGNELKCEYFAGEYRTTVPEGHESVIAHIENHKLDSKDSIVYAFGHLDDGVLKGFVQVYKDTSRVDGNYSIENISNSVVFSYDLEGDAFSVVRQFDHAVVVAVQRDVAIYWKDKAYYAYDMKTQSETYLVEDKAYDTGLSQLSTPAVFANEEMCVLHLVKGKTAENIENMYVFDFLTGEFFELTWQK